MIASQPLVKLDYFEVVEPRTLEPLAFNCWRPRSPARPWR